jgi:hypothetical protein
MNSGIEQCSGERTRPRVLFPAPSPETSQLRKFRMKETMLGIEIHISSARAPKSAREGACAPRNR